MKNQNISVLHIFLGTEMPSPVLNWIRCSIVIQKCTWLSCGVVSSREIFEQKLYFVPKTPIPLKNIPTLCPTPPFSKLLPATLTKFRGIFTQSILAWLKKSIWERDRERNVDLLFHFFMHSLVASCICLDPRSNPQPWCNRTTVQPTELSGQGYSLFSNSRNCALQI